MRAVLRHISPNDYLDWDTFVAADRTDPWDECGWFALDIGPDNEPGTEMFQVHVSTPAAASRARGTDKRFRGIIVDSFEPDVVKKALHTFVESITGAAWRDIVTELRQTMDWEYKGMREG